MKWKQTIRVLLLTPLAMGGAVGGQEVTWQPGPRPAGWIGITFDYTLLLQGEEERTVVVITDVAEGSPARAAGIRVGDTLTHLDGQPISRRVFNGLSTTLEPGDLVRMTIARNGRAREVLVEAARRPARSNWARPVPEEMIVRLDTLQGAILREMDSLRLSITGIRTNPEGEVSIHIVPRHGLTDVNVRRTYTFSGSFPDSLQVAPFVGLESLPGAGVPFPTLFVRTPAADSIQRELGELRRSITELRRAEARRRAELRASVRENLDEALETDSRIRALRMREEQLLEEQAELTERLRQVSEEEMQRQWAEIQARQELVFMEGRRLRALQEERGEENREEALQEAERVERFFEEQKDRYRSPVMVGQSFIMGAEIKALNPDLAQYFGGVEHGVLVTQVVEGTLAHEAGLKGGDVIVRLGGEEIRTLTDLRFMVSAIEGPIRLRVIRKGEPLQVVIRR